MKYDPCNEISKLNIPVLIIHGTTDIQVKTGEAKMLAESNKNSELIIIEGMNHILKDSDIERNANIATYSNPTLPLNGDLIDDISKFILK